MTTDIPTPETDQEILRFTLPDPLHGRQVVDADFARTLEQALTIAVSALQSISRETGTPYARIADEALAQIKALKGGAE